MIGSLVLIVLVLVLTYYATRWYARRMGHSASGRHIKVLDRSQLGAGTYVAVVKVGDKFYLLGVGEKSVSLLCELESFEEPAEAQGAVSLRDSSFSQVLRQVVDRTRGASQKKDGDDRP